jgi:hypothetical protein
VAARRSGKVAGRRIGRGADRRSAKETGRRTVREAGHRIEKANGPLIERAADRAMEVSDRLIVREDDHRIGKASGLPIAKGGGLRIGKASAHRSGGIDRPIGKEEIDPRIGKGVTGLRIEATGHPTGLEEIDRPIEMVANVLRTGRRDAHLPAVIGLPIAAQTARRMSRRSPRSNGAAGPQRVPR